MAYGDYPDLKGVQRVLVVKLRHLGDVLLTAPVFSALQEALPGAQLDALIYQEATPMLSGHPAVSEILGVDRGWKKRGFWGRMAKEAALLSQIRKNRYDLVLNLTEGDRGAMAARVSGARIRVGVDGRRVYTHVVKNCPTLRHTVERHLDAVRRMGIFPSSALRELFLHIPEDARARALQLAPWERYLLIHPTCRWRYKCWPMEKMRALSVQLIQRGERLVFTSGPDPIEQALVAEVTAGLSVCNLAGRVTLKELGALIERAAALVCVDSVPFHMASALKAPVVALFGPTSEVTWGPWRNPRARILTEALSCRPCYLDGCGGSKKSDCLAAISVERVLSELEVVAEVRAPRLRVVH